MSIIKSSSITSDLHLINSVGQARKETAIPAPAPQTICWFTVRVAPGCDLSNVSICPLTENRTALKAATVASGAPIPLYKPLGPSAATVCLTASIAPEYLGSWPGRGVGWLWSLTFMVSNGWPTISCATPPIVPAVRSFATSPIWKIKIPRMKTEDMTSNLNMWRIENRIVCFKNTTPWCFFPFNFCCSSENVTQVQGIYDIFQDKTRAKKRTKLH